MTTEREELTAIIDDRWHGYGYHPQGAADAIIAAGYRKPRTITTEDELDELSNKALIMTRHGEYREAAKTILSGNIWRGMGPTKVLRSAELAAWHLPATILHMGEGE